MSELDKRDFSREEQFWIMGRFPNAPSLLLKLDNFMRRMLDMHPNYGGLAFSRVAVFQPDLGQTPERAVVATALEVATHLSGLLRSSVDPTSYRDGLVMGARPIASGPAATEAFVRYVLERQETQMVQANGIGSVVLAGPAEPLVLSCFDLQTERVVELAIPPVDQAT